MRIPSGAICGEFLRYERILESELSVWSLARGLEFFFGGGLGLWTSRRDGVIQGPCAAGLHVSARRIVAHRQLDRQLCGESQGVSRARVAPGSVV